MPKGKILELLAPETPFIRWIFARLAGFTIATEPEFCGGVSKSSKLLDMVTKLYFTPDLFHDACEWKHLRIRQTSYYPNELGGKDKTRGRRK